MQRYWNRLDALQYRSSSILSFASCSETATARSWGSHSGSVFEVAHVQRPPGLLVVSFCFPLLQAQKECDHSGHSQWIPEKPHWLAAAALAYLPS